METRLSCCALSEDPGDTTVLQMRAADGQKAAVLRRFMLRSQGCLVRAQSYPEDSPASFAALRENGFCPGHNHDICILRLTDAAPRQSPFSAEAALTWETQKELLELTDQVFGRQSNYSAATHSKGG